MSLPRQVLYSAALLGTLGLLLWVQQQRIDLAQARLGQAEVARKAGDAELSRQAGIITALAAALSRERQAQADLDQQRQQLVQALATRERLIEDLKRDDESYRQWAGQPLPAAARRLRQRPAISGAVAYHQWLSGRDGLRASASGADEQRRSAD